MSTRSVVIALAAAAVILLLIKSLFTQPQTEAAAPKLEPSPVVSMVEETLHQHSGEQSPFVEAFNKALHPGGAQSG